MAKKKAIYRSKTESGVDDFMFETVAEQVFYEDGNSVKDKFDIKEGLLWRGYHHMSGRETVTPSKPLSKCQHGWILVWSDWDEGSEGQNWNFCFSYIPKNTPWLDGYNTNFPLCGGESSWAIKTLYIYDKYFRGNDTNRQDGNYDVVLRAVLEY